MRADIAVDTKYQTMTSVAFPITDEAKLSLLKLQDDEINYVQLVRNAFIEASKDVEFDLTFQI